MKKKICLSLMGVFGFAMLLIPQQSYALYDCTSTYSIMHENQSNGKCVKKTCSFNCNMWEDENFETYLSHCYWVEGPC